MQLFFKRISTPFLWIISPYSKIIAPEEIPKAKGLLLLIISFIFICVCGTFASPGYIRNILLITLPFLLLSYALAKTRYYKTGGLITILTTFVLAALIIIRLDNLGEFSYLSLSWITITVFMATIFLEFKSVFIITIIQIVYSITICMVAKSITFSVFISWFFLNFFFIIINLFTCRIIEKQHKMLIYQNNLLEEKVDKRTKKLSETLEEKDMLLKELYHRTKNNMQVISSLLKLQSATSDNVELNSALNEIYTRILTMSLVHEKLYKSNDLRSISFEEYILDLISEIYGLYSFNPSEVKMEINIIDVRTCLEDSIPLGLVIHELILNIFKHAYTEGKELLINVDSELHENNDLTIIVKDNGSGLPEGFEPEKSTSLGVFLANSIVKHQLGGEITFNSSDQGLTVIVKVPLKKEDRGIYTHSDF